MTQQMTPAQHARDAAFALLALSHATDAIDGPGWTYPGDARHTIGGLTITAQCLPQAISHTSALLTHQYTHQHLTDDGGDVHAAYSRAEAALLDAERAAQALTTAMEQVPVALWPFGYRE